MSNLGKIKETLHFILCFYRRDKNIYCIHLILQNTPVVHKSFEWFQR